jgi:hypothetical protein
MNRKKGLILIMVGIFFVLESAIVLIGWYQFLKGL